MHPYKDAAEIGYGGIFNLQNMREGVPGQLKTQGIWNWRDRARSITFRELKIHSYDFNGRARTEALAGAT